MAVLSNLHNELTKFWQLPHHHDEKLAEVLSNVQIWQRNRIENTHQTLLSNPKYRPMGDFLVQQLYGGDKLYPLIKQLQALLEKNGKIEKFIPESALQTGVAGVLEMVNAIQLDLALAEFLYHEQKPINEQSMIEAYQAVNQQTERYQQIVDLKETCYLAEKNLKSFMLQKAFSFAKPLAYQYNIEHLYDFIDAGLQAIQPIKQMSDFIEPFGDKENAIIHNVHAGKANPFVV